MLTRATPCLLYIHSSFPQKTRVELPSESGKNGKRLGCSPPPCSLLSPIDNFLPPSFSVWEGQHYLPVGAAANQLSDFLHIPACEEIQCIQNSELNSGFATADLEVIEASLNFLWPHSDSEEGEQTYWTGAQASFRYTSSQKKLAVLPGSVEHAGYGPHNSAYWHTGACLEQQLTGNLQHSKDLLSTAVHSLLKHLTELITMMLTVLL